ncbi:Mannan endo-1,6-alpha-mannosidase [Cercospora zeina]
MLLSRGNILLSVVLIIAPSSLTSPVLPVGRGAPSVGNNSSSSTSSAILNTLVATISAQIDYTSPPGTPTRGLIKSLPIAQSGWISASTYNTLINYWYLTHQQGHNQSLPPSADAAAPSTDPFTFTLSASILSQAGPQSDFSGAISPGNDDQLWWGLTAISAFENGLPGREYWLKFAKNVFKVVIDRYQWNMCPSATASGGLGWQIDRSMDGYHYKNAITNGLAFQLAARLVFATVKPDSHAAKFYADWADKLWHANLGGVIDEGSYKVFDGVHAPECKKGADEEWSYNLGVWMGGCAVMAGLNGVTKDRLEVTAPVNWGPRTSRFVDSAIATFTRENVLYEPRCEDGGTCNDDQQTFKAALARSMGLTARLVPETRERIKKVLEASRSAALTTVQASPGKNKASLKWSQKDGGGVGYDPKTANGVGAQLGLVELLVQSEGL